jgi:voltage-gated potassium channel
MRGVGQLRQRLVSAALVLGTTFVIGVLGYHSLGGEEHSWIDAIYMTANVLSTVGFREAIPVEGNTRAAIFTVVLLFFGAGALVYATSIITAFLVEGDLTEVFRSRRMQRAIRDMNGHYIVCGSGATGYAVLKELVHTKRQVVAIEMHDERYNRIAENFPTVPVLKEDFTDDEVLGRAGIERATGIVICTAVDKDSLVTTITARQMNPKLRIIARAVTERSMERLKHAGADGVVSPALIGGMRMASELVRPAVVGFLDLMLKDRDKNLRVEEVLVPAHSPFSGKAIGDLNAHARTNCLIMALKRNTGDYVYNPTDSTRLDGGSILVVMGDPDGVRALSDLCGSSAPVALEA